MFDIPRRSAVGLAAELSVGAELSKVRVTLYVLLRDDERLPQVRLLPAPAAREGHPGGEPVPGGRPSHPLL